MNELNEIHNESVGESDSARSQTEANFFFRDVPAHSSTHIESSATSSLAADTALYTADPLAPDNELINGLKMKLKNFRKRNRELKNKNKNLEEQNSKLKMFNIKLQEKVHSVGRNEPHQVSINNTHVAYII